MIPYCGRRLIVTRSCQHAQRTLRGLPILARVVCVGSNDESQAHLVLSRVTTSSPRIGIVRFSHGFKRRPTIATNVGGYSTSLTIVLSTSVRSPPRLVPSVLRLRRGRRTGIICYIHGSHRKRKLFGGIATGTFCHVLGCVDSIGFPLSANSFHLVSHGIVSRFSHFRRHKGCVHKLVD